MNLDRPLLFVIPMLAGLSAAPPAADAQAPSYATPSYAARTETITGTIASVQNVNHLFVADDRGYTDDVTLREGASVFSNGVRLEPGERVSIQGSAAGKTFLATRIATSSRSYSSAAAPPAGAPPAAMSYPVPVPVYYSVPVPAPAYYPAPIYYSAYYAYRPFFRPYDRYFCDYSPFYGSYRPFFDGYRPFYGSYRPFFGGYRSFYGAFHGSFRPYHPVSIGASFHFR